MAWVIKIPYLLHVFISFRAFLVLIVRLSIYIDLFFALITMALYRLICVGNSRVGWSVSNYKSTLLLFHITRLFHVLKGHFPGERRDVKQLDWIIL